MNLKVLSTVKCKMNPLPHILQGDIIMHDIEIIIIAPTVAHVWPHPSVNLVLSSARECHETPMRSEEEARMISRPSYQLFYTQVLLQ